MGAQSRRQRGGGRSDATPQEPRAQPLERAGDPLIGGLFRQREVGGNLGKALAFEVPQQDGHPVLFSQAEEGLVEKGPDMDPVVLEGGVVRPVLHGVDYVFANSAAPLRLQELANLVTGCGVEPSDDAGVAQEGRCPLGEDDEDRLGDILRVVGLAPHLAPGGMEYQADVPFHEGGEGFLGLIIDETA